MEYKFHISIDRYDEPKLSKHGNPCLRFSLSWGLLAYDENGEEILDAHKIESSDGNILTVDVHGELVLTRTRGWMGIAVLRSTPGLNRDILDALDSAGLLKKLKDYAESVRFKKPDADSIIKKFEDKNIRL